VKFWDDAAKRGISSRISPLYWTDLWQGAITIFVSFCRGPEFVVKDRIQDADTDSDSPDTPTSLRPTRAIEVIPVAS